MTEAKAKEIYFDFGKMNGFLTKAEGKTSISLALTETEGLVIKWIFVQKLAYLNGMTL